MATNKRLTPNDPLYRVWPDPLEYGAIIEGNNPPAFTNRADMERFAQELERRGLLEPEPNSP